MGGIYYRVGDYGLTIMDYALDDLPEDGSETADIYDTIFIDCEITRVSSRRKKGIKIRASDLYSIKKYDDGKYSIDWDNDARGPRDCLFNELKRKKIPIEASPVLSIHATGRDWKLIPKYYLNSDIKNEDIIVTIKPRVFTIKSIDELEWLGQRGFNYD